MSLILEVDGTPYENFKSATVFRSIEAISSTFDFVATISTFKDFPIKLQSRVRVLIGNTPILTGFVSNLTPSYDNNFHEIRVSGISKTEDVVKSSVLSNVNYSPRISLKNLIKRLLAGNNMDIDVIDNVNPKPFGQGDIIDGEVGENMFDIINKYCMKRQVLATTNGNGDIVLTRGSSERLPVKLIHKQSSRENNVLKASAPYSVENRFHAYFVNSELNPLAINKSGGKSSAETIVNQSGGAIDSKIRRTRDLVLQMDDSNTSETATQRAKWESNIRTARGFSYSCTVQGLTIKTGSSIIWEPNKLVLVEDEKVDISSELLIKSVRYSFSLDGTITELDLVSKNSYQPLAEQSKLSARTNKFGADII